MRRLKIAASIIGHYMKEYVLICQDWSVFPINVSAINGWLTSTTKFECAALLTFAKNAVEMQHRS